MQQLSGLDNSFLHLETPAVYGHVSSLAIFEPGERSLQFDEVRALIQERLHLVAPFRRRLVGVPLSIDHPYWIEDPDFDLDYHLRHIAVPPPGDERQLAELAAELSAKHLDRRRPLWEMYIIDGLAGGAVAELTKIHHACIDGVSGAEILGVLLDLTPEPPPVAPPDEPWRPEAEPSQWSMLGRGLAGLVSRPRVGFRLARRTVPRLGAVARNFALARAVGAPAAGAPLGPRLERAPHTVQRDDHAAPALLVRVPAARRGEVGEAAARWHRERRRDGDVRGCAAAVAARARRAPRDAAAGDGAGLGTDRGAAGHVRQPGVGDDRRAAHGRVRSDRTLRADARRR